MYVPVSPSNFPAEQAAVRGDACAVYVGVYQCVKSIYLA